MQLTLAAGLSGLREIGWTRRGASGGLDSRGPKLLERVNCDEYGGGGGDRRSQDRWKADECAREVACPADGDEPEDGRDETDNHAAMLGHTPSGRYPAIVPSAAPVTPTSARRASPQRGLSPPVRQQ